MSAHDHPETRARGPSGGGWLRTVAIILLLAGCGDAATESPTAPAAPGPPVHSILIETAGGEIRYHQELPLRVIARDLAGNVLPTPPVVWSSSQPVTVSVSESGVVRGEGIGNAQIKAKVGNREATVSFTVPSRQVDLRMNPGGVVSVVDFNHDIECDRDCSRHVALGATLELRVEKAIGAPPVTWPPPCPESEAERCTVRVDNDLVFSFEFEHPARPSAFATAIDAGTAMACALSQAGDAYCWGSNNGGKLGRGIWTRFAPEPARVEHGEPFHSITVGNQHACGLTVSGVPVCWGNNQFGAVGDGSVQHRPSPTAVSGNPRFVQISAGFWHTCAVTGGGEAYCWGQNQHGELGDGTQIDRRRPTRVLTDVKFRQVRAGREFTCGLSIEDTLYCWGRNLHGQLATGDFSPSLVPRPSSSTARYRSLSLGSFMGCALREEGTLDCWGEDRGGSLGQGSQQGVRIPSPSPVATSERFVSVSVGQVDFACGLTAEGRALCWGSNWDGALGTGNRNSASRPVAVAGAHRFTGLGAGDGLTCAIDVEGQSHCWGRAHDGALGLGVQSFSTTPVPLPSVPASRALVGKSWNTHCSFSEGSGDLYCWGGWGPVAQRSSQWEVSLQLQGFSQAALGSGNICSLRDGDGALFCIGDAHRGRLGNGLFSGWIGFPGHRVRPDLTFRDVVAGPDHTCALDTRGQALCWGSNQFGQLGDGGWQDRAEPVAVLQGSLHFDKLAAANHTTCGVTSERDLWCWGQNHQGQIGDGSLQNRNRPTRVVGDLKVAEVAIGVAHTCLLTVEKATYCWGAQWAGQIGIRANREHLTPFRVPGNEAFQRLSVGAHHSCGWNAAGDVWCWGDNVSGQLGLGHRAEVLGPQRVEGLPPVDEVSAGWDSTCARAQGGAVWCWGTNANGQLAREIPQVPVRIEAPVRFRSEGSTPWITQEFSAVWGWASFSE
jgi:alpha-tubulin suppressor-like RCC1 family protein